MEGQSRLSEKKKPMVRPKNVKRVGMREYYFQKATQAVCGRHLSIKSRHTHARLKKSDHHRRVHSREKQDQRRSRHELRRKANKRKDQIDSFWQRRLDNFAGEARITGAPMRSRPEPPSQPAPRKCRSKPTKKDWSFYKRTGFLWSELGMVSPKRLPLVVPTVAIKRDRECFEMLVVRVEQEEAELQRRCQERSVAGGRHKPFFNKEKMRVSQRRHQLPHQQGGRGRTKEHPRNLLSVKKNSGPQRHGAVPCTVPQRSERQDQLATPRAPIDKKRLYIMSGSSDMQGLLCTNPMLENVLPWHIEKIRREINQQRFKHYGRPRTLSASQPSCLHLLADGNESSPRGRTRPSQTCPHTSCSNGGVNARLCQESCTPREELRQPLPTGHELRSQTSLPEDEYTVASSLSPDN